MKKILLGIFAVLWASTALAQTWGLPIGPTGGWLPLSGGSLTFQQNNGLTLNGVGSATFQYPTSSVGGNFSTGELLLDNNVTGQNVLTIQNNNTGGFSVLTARGNDNVEHSAIGWANAGSGYIAAGGTFWEWSSFNNSTGDRASFTGSISGTTLTTSAPTGTIAIGQLISDVSSGNNITAGTIITAGSGSSWTVNNSQTLGSRAMTSGLPVPKAYFIRTGFYPSTGTYRTTASSYVENYTGIDGRQVWPTIDASPSQSTFIIDPTNDFVTVNNQLLVGNINTTRTPTAAIDNYGHMVLGSNPTNRSTDCSGWLFCNNEQTVNQVRLINANNLKSDILLSTATIFRMDFKDTDHCSGCIPLSLAMNGSGMVGFGGTSTGNVLTSSNVGLLGNGTELDVKLADNSGFAPIKASTATFSALANVATTSAVCYNTGTGVVTYDGTLGTCTVSDANLKDIDGSITGALDKLLRINGVYFHFKDQTAYGSGQKLGVTAQNVAEVFPELVSRGSDGNLSADYAKLTAPIIEAMRELKLENDYLKACQYSWKCRLFGWR